jgi:serine/threonine protein phosphatase PrpC
MSCQPPDAELNSMSKFWKVVAASAKGSSHEKTDIPCQDAHYWKVIDGVLLAAVADGAGSATHSDLGAKIAAQAAVDYLYSNLTFRGQLDLNAGGQSSTELNPRQLLSGWNSIAVVVAEEACKAVHNAATQRETPIRELASTLLVLVASDAGIAVLQIGDGAIVVNTFGDTFVALTTPPQTEYINETVFLVSSSAIEKMQIKTFGKVKQVALMSDGLQMLALEMKERKPFEPFFRHIFKFAYNSINLDTSNRQLMNFLISDRVRSKTDDDITLFLASFYEEDQEIASPNSDVDIESTQAPTTRQFTSENQCPAIPAHDSSSQANWENRVDSMQSKDLPGSNGDIESW